MRLRLAFSAVGSIAALVVLLPALAQACNFPSLHPSSQAGPGDPVSYSVGNLDPGATYDIAVDGRAVVSGGSAASGSFTMPNLGSQARDVPAVLTVYHDDLANPYTEPTPPTIAYQPPAPPPAEEPTAPPAEESGNGSPQPGDPNRTARPDGSGLSGGPATVPGAPAAIPAGLTPTGIPTSPAAQLGSTEPVTVNATASTGREERVAVPVFATVRALEPQVAVPAATDAGSIVDPDPAAVIAMAVAIALILGSGGALVRAVREPRFGPGDERLAPVAIAVPHEIERAAALRSALIEAELQEMIAEARASELLAGDEHGTDADLARSD